MTGDPLNDVMWAHYGANSSGFCIGFDLVELFRNIQCAMGPAKYVERFPIHSFLAENNFNKDDTSFLKAAKWDYEKEFRLITYAIAKDQDRAKKLPSNAIVEVVIGAKMSQKNRIELFEAVQNLKSQVELFEVMEDVNGLKKVPIPRLGGSI